jgi:hypothetical protein
MENEFANFGLPSDPANQPIQPRQTAAADVQRGWFSRNWWWSLPTAFLILFLPCAGCLGIFGWVIGALKSSEPYRMALERVRTNPAVIDMLGKPIEEAGWMPTGNFSYHINNGVASGSARFDFSVSGPQDTARVHAEAVCRDGKWRFRVLQVTPASSGKVMSLPVDKKPTEAEEETAPDWK